MSYIIPLVAVILLDQWTKFWIVDNLALYSSKTVIPGLFNLVYVTNAGAAFSMFADIDSPLRHYAFLLIGCCAVIGLSILAYRLKDKHLFYGIAFGLISGGAIGNLLDRVRVGSVIDFLDFYLGRYHWPAFNVADSAILVGVTLFLIVNFFDAKKNPE